MWEVKIKMLDLAKQVARITAVHTEAATEEVWLWHGTAIIETASQRTAILDQIKSNYLEYLNSQDQADTVIAGLEDTAVNALNSWEGTL